MKLLHRLGARLSPPVLAVDSAPAAAAPPPATDLSVSQVGTAAGFLLREPAFSRPLAAIDQLLPATAIRDRPALFADTPPDIFALLCLHRPPEYPNLSGWLPTMPAEDLQLASTGATGQRTMMEASSFVSAVARRCQGLGIRLGDADVLDFGACWARVARLFYQHTPTDRLFAVDAWPDNLQSARDCGFAGRLAPIDEHATASPFPDVAFDVVVAFSVFTHLSPASATAALRVIHDGMSKGGLLAVTLRPNAATGLFATARSAAIAEGLASTGCGFAAEPWSKGGAYGDVVMTPDYIRSTWTDFELIGIEANAVDPYQLYCFLRPR